MAKTILKKRRFHVNLKRISFVFLFLFSIYLSIQLIWGQNGVYAKAEFKLSVDNLRHTLAEKKLEIEKIKASLALLDPNNIDVDYVSEILRQELYWILPNEYLIILPE